MERVCPSSLEAARGNDVPSCLLNLMNSQAHESLQSSTSCPSFLALPRDVSFAAALQLHITQTHLYKAFQDTRGIDAYGREAKLRGTDMKRYASWLLEPLRRRHGLLTARKDALGTWSGNITRLIVRYQR